MRDVENKRYQTPNYDLSANIAAPEDYSRLVLVHPGFLETWQYAHLRGYVDLFSRLGCLAICPDAPGTWGSRVRPGSKRTARPFEMNEYCMFRMVDASEEIIEEELKIKPDLKITSIGHSLGGMGAIYDAKRYPEHVDSIILDRSPTRWVRESNEAERRAWEEAGTETFYKTDPNGDGSVRFDVSSLFTPYTEAFNGDKDLKKLKVKKLFIAARRDKQVLLEDIEADFVSAAEPKEIAVVNSNHYYLSWLNVLRNSLASRSLIPIPRKKPYTNRRITKKNMGIVEEWAVREVLSPNGGQ